MSCWVRFGLAASVSLPLFAGQAAAGDVLDTVRCSGTLATLAAAFEAAGIEDRLKGPGPVTLFAPTDAAFALLPAGTMDDLLRPESRERLVAFLDRLVVPGRIVIGDLSGRRASVATAEGGVIDIDARNGELAFGEAEVLNADILADNGVVHVIDSLPN